MSHAPGDPEGQLSRSMLIPLLGDRTGFSKKAYLVPAVLTAVAVMGMYYWGDPDHFGYFCYTFALYIALMMNWAFYQICGRDKPWWVLVGVGGAMVLMLWPPAPLFDLIYPIFDDILPGRFFEHTTDPFLNLLAAFCGPGLREEFYKAIPLLVLAWVGLKWKDPFAKVIGLTEPLDGILMGIASGTGFTLVETLTDYVPKAIQQGGAAAGLMLLLPRILDNIGGHVAYSGYFGFFIGAAVLRPRAAPKLLLTGWLSSAALHGAWDGLPPSVWVEFGLLILSYGCLIAAILKARKISPTRSQNFATVIAPVAAAGSMSRAAGPAVAVLRPAPASAPQPAAAAAPAPRGADWTLVVNNVRYPIKPGTQVQYQVLGSAGAGRGKGALAEVEANPNDAAALGLRNSSSGAWRATLPSGEVIDVPQGRVVRLQPGVKIDFGGVEGRVLNEA